jgi:hypothetical protein
MPRWQAEITGHRFDLDDLRRLLTAHDLEVIEDDGTYYLEAAEFEGLTDGAAVHRASVDLLPLVNGVGKLHSSSFEDVGVGHVRELGDDGTSRHHTVVVADTAHLRTRVDAVIIRPGESESQEPAEPPPGSQESDTWMRAARATGPQRRALALWGGRHDPINLWKVWEIIRDHSGLAINPDDIRRFRPAVNDPTIAGQDARHETTRHQLHPDTMSLTEAEAFLAALLKRWLS